MCTVYLILSEINRFSDPLRTKISFLIKQIQIVDSITDLLGIKTAYCGFLKKNVTT